MRTGCSLAWPVAGGGDIRAARVPTMGHCIHSRHSHTGEDSQSEQRITHNPTHHRPPSTGTVFPTPRMPGWVGRLPRGVGGVVGTPLPGAPWRGPLPGEGT